MEILDNTDLVICDYLVSLQCGTVTPKQRTELKNIVSGNIGAARKSLDALLKYYVGANNRARYADEFRVLGLDVLSTVECALTLFDMAAHGHSLIEAPKATAVNKIQEFVKSAEWCNDPHLCAGIKTTALTAILWLNLVSDALEQTRTLIKEVKSGCEAWIPDSVAAALR